MGKKKAEKIPAKATKKIADDEAKKAQAEAQKMVGNAKNVLIDERSLFIANEDAPKIVMDAIRSLGKVSMLTIATADPTSIKAFFAKHFMIDKEVEVPVYEDMKNDNGEPMKDAENKPMRKRVLVKKMMKIQEYQPTIVECEDDRSLLNRIEMMHDTSSRDMWVIVGNKKVMCKYFKVDEIFKVPNQETQTTQAGSAFRMFLVDKANSWRDVVASDEEDVVIDNGPEGEIDNKSEEIIPDK